MCECFLLLKEEYSYVTICLLYKHVSYCRYIMSSRLVRFRKRMSSYRMRNEEQLQKQMVRNMLREDTTGYNLFCKEMIQFDRNDQNKKIEKINNKDTNEDELDIMTMEYNVKNIMPMEYNLENIVPMDFNMEVTINIESRIVMGNSKTMENTMTKEYNMIGYRELKEVQAPIQMYTEVMSTTTKPIYRLRQRMDKYRLRHQEQQQRQMRRDMSKDKEHTREFNEFYRNAEHIDVGDVCQHKDLTMLEDLNNTQFIGMDIQMGDTAVNHSKEVQGE